MVNTELQNKIIGLYIALFGRAPEKDGLEYWLNEAENKSLSQIADEMISAAKQYPDAYPQYANLDVNNEESVREFVNNLYQILFDKDYNTDPEGIDYWVNEILSGKDLGEVVTTLQEAATQYLDSTDENAKKAAETFVNRIQAGEQIANEFQKADLNGDGVIDAKELSFFKDIIKEVNNDPNTIEKCVLDAKEKWKDYAGKILDLSYDADNLTGTIGNDVIEAGVALNPINGEIENTLDNVDVIDGGDGFDVLNLKTDGGTINTEIKNVEEINLKAFDTTTFNLSNVTGLEILTNKDSIADVTFDNVPEISEVNVINDKYNTTFNFINPLENLKVNIQNVTGTITLNGEIQKAELNVSDSNVTLNGTAFTPETELDITGSGSVSITGNIAFSKLNADGTDFNLDLTNATIGDIVTGTGNDSVSITDYDGQSIDLGNGTNTLTINGTYNIANFKGINVLELKQGGTLDLNGISIDKIIVDGDTTIQNGEVKTIELNGSNLTLDGNAEINVNSNANINAQDVTLNLNDSVVNVNVNELIANGTGTIIGTANNVNAENTDGIILNVTTNDIITGNGDDKIAGTFTSLNSGNGSDVIDASQTDASITTGLGIDSVTLDGAAEHLNTINDFDTNTDKIILSENLADVNGDNSKLSVLNGDDISEGEIDTGLVIITNKSTPLTNDDILTFLDSDIDGDGSSTPDLTLKDNGICYVIVTDGTDSAIVKAINNVDDSGDSNPDDIDEVAILGILKDVNPSDLTAENFANFVI